MKLIFTLVIGCIIASSLNAETTTGVFSEGSGTQTDPYQITTLDQLFFISDSSKYWSDHFILVADINASITKNYSFKPIANNDNPFTGSFDGNGHVIDSLHIYAPNTQFCGLFGSIKNATVKHLGITNCDITLGDKSGGLAGSANASLIEGCYVTGYYDAFSSNVAGAIVGAMTSSEMKSCYSDCDVISTTGGNNHGGLAGIVWGSSVISDCYILGKVYCGSNYGGVAGQVQSSEAIVNNCYYAGKMSTSKVITSVNSGTITNCFFDNTLNTGTSSHATGVQTSSFSNKNFFSTFNFDVVWHIGSLPHVDSETRPFFRWQFDHHTVKFVAGSLGYISGGFDVQYLFTGENSLSIQAVPSNSDDYHFLEWRNASGDSITNVNPLTINNVTKDSTLYAIFVVNWLNVVFQSGGNGSISGDTSQTIYYGENASAITAIPDEGYALKYWQNAEGSSISSENPFTLTYVTMKDTITAIFEKASSSFDIESVKELNVTPNPTTGLINILLQSETEVKELKIYNLSGKQVYCDPSFNGGQVNLSHLNSGMYLINISTVDKVHHFRIIKE
jgi:hypothetical protein